MTQHPPIPGLPYHVGLSPFLLRLTTLSRKAQRVCQQNLERDKESPECHAGPKGRLAASLVSEVNVALGKFKEEILMWAFFSPRVVSHISLAISSPVSTLTPFLCYCISIHIISGHIVP